MNRRLYLNGFWLLILMFSFSFSYAEDLKPGRDSQQSQLNEVLDQIGDKYLVVITYNAQLVSGFKTQFEFIEEENVETAVGRALEDTGLEFKRLTEKYYVVFKEEKPYKRELNKLENENGSQGKPGAPNGSSKGEPYMVKFTSLMVSPAEVRSAFLPHEVRGVVTDETGEPLIGVSILVQGSGSGTITDIDGYYSIDLPIGNETLVFSYTGYEPLEIAVENRTTIDVSMSTSISQLDEVVVIGYGTVKKRDVTGAVGSLEADEFSDEVISSVNQGLQGKVAGVNVTSSSGAPGGNMIVRIRGNNSVIGSNDPLYVIDGFPVSSGNVGETNLLSTLNPGDIESVEVLKDASATAIYGSRGSNGVILITTKQGAQGVNRIDFETAVGFRNPERTIDLMNSAEFLDLANEWFTNDGEPAYFDDQEVAELSQIETDWQDEVFRTGLVQNHSLRFSGGNESTRIMLSGNYYNEEGIMVGSDFERGSLRMNLDKDFGEKFQLTSRVMFSRSINNQVNDDAILFSALAIPPFLEPYNEDGSYVPAADLKPYPFSDGSGVNPVAVANEQLNRSRIDRLLANVSGSYEILEGLTLRILLGVDNYSTKRDGFSPRVLEAGLPAGTGSRSYSNSTNFLNENTLNYSTGLFGRDHLNFTLGYTWQHTQSDGLSSSASNFVTDDLQSDDLGSGENFSAPNTSYSDWTLLSFLGRLNYSIADKYLFTFSGRSDGSSNFGEGNKWGFFPSAAFAWRLSDENFIQNALPSISDLKFRASWGVSGNQAISPYQTLQRFSSVSLAFGGAVNTGFRAENLGNPNLRWETTEEFNVGLEFGFWNQRLSFSADYYIKNTDDLLALVNLPPTAGFATTLQNIGSTKNTGFELGLGAVIIRTNKVRWDLNANLAANQNTVTATAGGQEIIVAQVEVLGSANIVREGEPLSSFFGLETDGLTDDGMFNYVDQNGDGEVNDADRLILGSPYPSFFYGFSSDLAFGRFDLRLNFQGEHGKQIWNQNRYRYMSSLHRGANSVSDAVENRWSPSNPDPNAPYPRASRNLNQRPSDWFVEEASYLRLQNLRFGYDIPVGDVSKGLRSLNVYVSCQNLFTITPYSWFTPDVNNWGSGDLRIGIDMRTYPSARSVMFGLKFGI